MLPVVFYTSPKEHRIEIAERFALGVRKHGDLISFQPLGTGFAEGRHAAIIIGNKQRYLLNPLVERQCPIFTLDRAYAILDKEGQLGRALGYSRVSTPGTHPLQAVGALGMPADRRERFNWNPKPWRKEGEFVVLAGSSRSYYERIGLTETDQIKGHLADLIKQIRAHTKKMVAFRAKPNTLNEIGPVEGAICASHRDITLPDLFGVTHTVVTEESSITIEALLCGIPCVVLGPSPTLWISSNAIDQVDTPILAGDDAKTRLLNDLGYFQYNQVEYQDGTAWEFLRKLVV